MRIITYVEAELVQTEDTTDVYLLSIYDKSNYENISEALLKSLVEDIQEELLEEMEAGEKQDTADDDSKNEAE
jgi:hypothetical protein